MRTSCLSSTLIYGRTGEGKTALLGAAAQWIFEQSGKPMRLYSAEPGRLGTIDHLIRKGRIEVLDLRRLANASEAIDAAGKGFWPTASGELVETKDWSKVGAIAYEGMTEFAEMILNELSIKGGANQIMSAEKPPAQYMSGKLKVAGTNETYFGVAQRQVHRAVDESQNHPVHVIWTARERRVIDQATKQAMCGPQIAGKAATLDCPSWFGETVHVDSVPVFDERLKKDILERRVYLQTHLDHETGMPILAQVRVPISMAKEIPEFIKVQNDEGAMRSVFEKLEHLRKKAMEAL